MAIDISSLTEQDQKNLAELLKACEVLTEVHKRRLPITTYSYSDWLDKLADAFDKIK